MKHTATQDNKGIALAERFFKEAAYTSRCLAKRDAHVAFCWIGEKVGRLSWYVSTSNVNRKVVM